MMAKKKSDDSTDTSEETLGAETANPPEEMFGTAHGPEPETDAAARLKAFEDKHLGDDAVRIGGHVERGVGSPWSRLSPARHREYEAIEKVVETERKLGEAHTALVQADVDHEAAMAALAAAEAEPDADPAA